jgi:zinc transport system substrate-binding protein
MLSLAACSAPPKPAADADQLSIVVAFYPLQYLAEQVGGASVNVTSLTSSNAEPHDLELSPAQISQIAEADLVVYIKGFQPAIDQAVEQVKPASIIDAGAETLPTTEQATDYHYWLDPALYAHTAQQIGEALSQLQPDQASSFNNNTQTISQRLGDLQDRFANQLAHCNNNVFVVTHPAFGFLAKRFNLQQLGIGGLDPDAEVSPVRLREITDQAKGLGVATVFYEAGEPADAAAAVAELAGANWPVDALDSMERGSIDGDYFSRMDQNLAALSKALQCTTTPQ